MTWNTFDTLPEIGKRFIYTTTDAPWCTTGCAILTTPLEIRYEDGVGAPFIAAIFKDGKDLMERLEKTRWIYPPEE